MKTRPYLNFSTAQLDSLVRTHWTDRGMLDRVHAELRFHASPEAAALRVEIDDRLSALADGDKPRAPRRPRDEEAADTLQIARMAAEIRARDARLREQTALIEHLRDRLRVETGAAALYRSVGLHEHCPDFVLEAARKAHLKANHPDLRPESGKSEAEERFKQLQKTFENIARIRAEARRD